MNRLLSDNISEETEEENSEEYLSEDYFFGGSASRSEKKVYSLVIYDIINNKKRTKFAKYMNAFGTRVQKSCFETTLSHKTFQKMLKGIGKYCDREDSIRVYRVNSKSQVYTWGRESPLEGEDVIIL